VGSVEEEGVLLVVVQARGQERQEGTGAAGPA